MAPACPHRPPPTHPPRPPTPARAPRRPLPQAIALARRPHIIVGTPGRVVDHLSNTKGFTLRSLKHLVLDEADKLLDMDFEQEIDQILKARFWGEALCAVGGARRRPRGAWRGEGGCGGGGGGVSAPTPQAPFPRGPPRGGRRGSAPRGEGSAAGSGAKLADPGCRRRADRVRNTQHTHTHTPSPPPRARVRTPRADHPPGAPHAAVLRDDD
jgi:hypothetical protein